MTTGTTTTHTHATVAVARDAAAATGLVKDLVDGLNAALTEMRSLTAYGAGGAGKGLLAGDSLVRSLQGRFSGTLFAADGSTLAALGVQLDRNGAFVLDETRLTSAYAADPAAVAAAFSSGFAERVREAAHAASNSKDGALTTAITGRQAGIDRLEDGVEAWDRRLEVRRATLSRQFTALETALSQLNGQSTWLAGQISSLPTLSG